MDKRKDRTRSKTSQRTMLINGSTTMRSQASMLYLLEERASLPKSTNTGDLTKETDLTIRKTSLIKMSITGYGRRLTKASLHLPTQEEMLLLRVTNTGKEFHKTKLPLLMREDHLKAYQQNCKALLRRRTTSTLMSITDTGITSTIQPPWACTMTKPSTASLEKLEESSEESLQSKRKAKNNH